MSVTLTGGPFTNAHGDAVASGKLRLKLNKEARRSTGQVCPTIAVDIPLDANGSIASSTTVYGNDELTPSDTFYYATVLDSNGAQVYGTVLWTLTGGGTIDVGTITPSTGVAGAGNPVQSSFDKIFFDRSNQDVVLQRASANVLELGTGDSFNPQSDQQTLGSSVKRWITSLFNAVFYGSSSGSTTVQASATASGTLTLPAATDTLVGKNTTDTLTNKTLTAPVIASISNSGTVTLPTGTRTLVARDTTDTLTNKTLNGASSGNAVNLLNIQGTLAPVVGNAADQNFYSYTLPANILGSGKALRVRAQWRHSTGSASVAYKFKFGSTLITIGSDSSTNQTNSEIIIYNKTTTTQLVVLGPAVDFTTIIGAPASDNTFAEDTTTSKTVAVTFNVANTDQVTPIFFMVELMQ